MQQSFIVDVASKTVVEQTFIGTLCAPDYHAEKVYLRTTQGEVGISFKVVLTYNGEPFVLSDDVQLSVWYEGSSGKGNYTTINECNPFILEGNNLQIELIPQMTTVPGSGTIGVMVHGRDGSIRKLFHLTYITDEFPGYGSATAEEHFTAFAESVRNALDSATKAMEAAATFETDSSFTVEGKAADAAAVGEAMKALILTLHPVGSIYITMDTSSPASLFGGTWEQLKDRFLLGAGVNYAVGATGGEVTHALTVDELPAHDHQVHTDMIGSDAGGIGTNDAPYLTKASKVPWYGNPRTSSVGGNAAHNNMPPYLAVYMWKRVA